MNDIIKLIVDNLDDTLLKKQYLNLKNKNKYTGHCYVASEALYHLLDDVERNKYTPVILKLASGTHWCLKNKQTNEIVDITKDQFDHILDYTKARNVAFLTKQPSKRTQTLLNKIYEKTGI